MNTRPWLVLSPAATDTYHQTSASVAVLGWLWVVMERFVYVSAKTKASKEHKKRR